MMMMKSILRFLIFVLPSSLISSQNTSDDAYNSTAYRLVTHLLRRYDKGIRPVMHPSDSIMVNIFGSPYQIINVDQKRNLISISAHFQMVWKDAYLQWTPAEFNGSEYVLLQVSKIWTPDVFVYYSSDHKSIIESIFNVRVNHTGHVHSFVPFRTETICPIDVKHFPFDQQHCEILFGSWPPNGAGVHLQIVGGGENLDVDDFYDSQEWTLKNFSLLYDISSSYKSDNSNIVVMHLHIVRQWFYYVFNLVIPSALICVLSVIGFHLPSAATGGRLTKSRLGMMTLLSMSVLLLSVVNEMPKFAFEAVPGKKGSFSSVPLIGIYYFSLLAIISLATISSSLMVVLEKSVIRNGVPGYLRWLLIEEWSCWGNRSKSQPPLSSSKTGCSVYESSKAAITHDFCAKPPNSTDPRELIDPNENAATTKTNRQRPLQMADCGDEQQQQRLTDICQSIQSLLSEAVHLLSGMRAVLAEPLSQCYDPYAGLVMKRLECFCLIFYLCLVCIVLLMFFCWEGWYGFEK